jgi:hypothetical protein
MWKDFTKIKMDDGLMQSLLYDTALEMFDDMRRRHNHTLTPRQKYFVIQKKQLSITTSFTSTLLQRFLVAYSLVFCQAPDSEDQNYINYLRIKLHHELITNFSRRLYSGVSTR